MAIVQPNLKAKTFYVSEGVEGIIKINVIKIDKNGDYKYDLSWYDNKGNWINIQNFRFPGFCKFHELNEDYVKALFIEFK